MELATFRTWRWLQRFRRRLAVCQLRWLLGPLHQHVLRLLLCVRGVWRRLVRVLRVLAPPLWGLWGVLRLSRAGWRLRGTFVRELREGRRQLVRVLSLPWWRLRGVFLLLWRLRASRVLWRWVEHLLLPRGLRGTLRLLRP